MKRAIEWIRNTFRQGNAIEKRVLCYKRSEQQKIVKMGIFLGL
jgi:hypothetical protein